jgi:uncharacterized protein with HEPN domain
MSRDLRMVLEDIVTSSDKIGRYTIGLTFDRFVADDRTFDAVVRNLEIIGEASKSVPDSIRSQYQDVPWRKMAALRDVVIHGYFGIDKQLVWDIVQKDIPTTRLKVSAILATAFPST